MGLDAGRAVAPPGMILRYYLTTYRGWRAISNSGELRPNPRNGTTKAVRSLDAIPPTLEMPQWRFCVTKGGYLVLRLVLPASMPREEWSMVDVFREPIPLRYVDHWQAVVERPKPEVLARGTDAQKNTYYLVERQPRGRDPVQDLGMLSADRTQMRYLWTVDFAGLQEPTRDPREIAYQRFRTHITHEQEPVWDSTLDVL